MAFAFGNIGCVHQFWAKRGPTIAWVAACEPALEITLIPSDRFTFCFFFLVSSMSGFAIFSHAVHISRAHSRRVRSTVYSECSHEIRLSTTATVLVDAHRYCSISNDQPVAEIFRCSLGSRRCYAERLAICAP